MKSINADIFYSWLWEDPEGMELGNEMPQIGGLPCLVAEDEREPCAHLSTADIEKARRIFGRNKTTGERAIIDRVTAKFFPETPVAIESPIPSSPPVVEVKEPPPPELPARRLDHTKQKIGATVASFLEGFTAPYQKMGEDADLYYGAQARAYSLPRHSEARFDAIRKINERMEDNSFASWGHLIGAVLAGPAEGLKNVVRTTATGASGDISQVRRNALELYVVYSIGAGLVTGSATLVGATAESALFLATNTIDSLFNTNVNLNETVSHNYLDIRNTLNFGKHIGVDVIWNPLWRIDPRTKEGLIPPDSARTRLELLMQDGLGYDPESPEPEINAADAVVQAVFMGMIACGVGRGAYGGAMKASKWARTPKPVPVKSPPAPAPAPVPPAVPAEPLPAIELPPVPPPPEVPAPPPQPLPPEAPPLQGAPLGVAPKVEMPGKLDKGIEPSGGKQAKVPPPPPSPPSPPSPPEPPPTPLPTPPTPPSVSPYQSITEWVKAVIEGKQVNPLSVGNVKTFEGPKGSKVRYVVDHHGSMHEKLLGGRFQTSALSDVGPNFHKPNEDGVVIIHLNDDLAYLLNVDGIGGAGRGHAAMRTGIEAITHQLMEGAEPHMALKWGGVGALDKAFEKGAINSESGFCFVLTRLTRQGDSVLVDFINGGDVRAVVYNRLAADPEVFRTRDGSSAQLRREREAKIRGSAMDAVVRAQLDRWQMGLDDPLVNNPLTRDSWGDPVDAAGSPLQFRFFKYDQRPLSPGDVMVIASDGLWGVLTPAEVWTLIKEAKTPAEALQLLWNKLYQFVDGRILISDNVNITVMFGDEAASATLKGAKPQETAPPPSPPSPPPPPPVAPAPPPPSPAVPPPSRPSSIGPSHQLTGPTLIGPERQLTMSPEPPAPPPSPTPVVEPVIQVRAEDGYTGTERQLTVSDVAPEAPAAPETVDEVIDLTSAHRVTTTPAPEPMPPPKSAPVIAGIPPSVDATVAPEPMPPQRPSIRGSAPSPHIAPVRQGSGTARPATPPTEVPEPTGARPPLSPAKPADSSHPPPASFAMDGKTLAPGKRAVRFESGVVDNRPKKQAPKPAAPTGTAPVQAKPSPRPEAVTMQNELRPTDLEPLPDEPTAEVAKAEDRGEPVEPTFEFEPVEADSAKTESPRRSATKDAPPDDEAFAMPDSGNVATRLKRIREDTLDDESFPMPPANEGGAPTQALDPASPRPPPGPPADTGPAATPIPEVVAAPPPLSVLHESRWVPLKMGGGRVVPLGHGHLQGLQIIRDGSVLRELPWGKQKGASTMPRFARDQAHSVGGSLKGVWSLKLELRQGDKTALVRFTERETSEEHFLTVHDIGSLHPWAREALSSPKFETLAFSLQSFDPNNPTPSIALFTRAEAGEITRWIKISSP